MAVLTIEDVEKSPEVNAEAPFAATPSPSSVTWTLPVLLRRMPLSPDRFVVLMVKVAARTPATMPTNPTIISVSAGTFFVVRRLSFTRMRLILGSLRKMWQALEDDKPHVPSVETTQ